MQVFYTSRDPRTSAQILDDIRVTKMITESAQIMSSVLIANGLTPPPKQTGEPYRPISPNHPCVLWANNRCNFKWLLQHYRWLRYTWLDRFGPRHHSAATHTAYFTGFQDKLPDFSGTLCNATGQPDVYFDTVEEAEARYQEYLAAKWEHQGSIRYFRKNVTAHFMISNMESLVKKGQEYVSLW